MRRITMATLMLVGSIGGALGGVALVGNLRGAHAQHSANTRMFSIADVDFPPAGDPVYYTLGNIADLDLGRDYRFTLTAIVSWNDADGNAQRGVALALDVDGFDINGNPVDWASELYPRSNQGYAQSNGASRNRVMLAQSIVDVPDNVATLKIQVFDQSGPTQPTPIHLSDVRLTMTPTAPPF